MGDPFTIRIFVPDGDPEGLRIIDRMNWTGLGIVFPREVWAAIKQRQDFGKPGVYVLVGYVSEEDDLPTLYIGQGDYSGKYKLIFSEPAKPIGPIPLADAPSGFMQGPRYTTYERLTKAKKITDLIVNPKLQ